MVHLSGMRSSFSMVLERERQSLALTSVSSDEVQSAWLRRALAASCALDLPYNTSIQLLVFYAGTMDTYTTLKYEETVITLYLREARRIPQEYDVDHGG